jgi:hypothetical protein
MTIWFLERTTQSPVRALGVQSQNVDFVESVFTGHIDFTVVPQSANNNGL